MTEEYQKAVTLYISVMAIFIDAYKKGEITKKEYKKIEKMVVEKTGLNPISVYRIKVKDIK